MGSVTVQFGTTYPTSTPGALGSGIAPFLASPKGEALITLSSSVNGFVDIWLLRWDSVSAWFPVAASAPPQPAPINAPQPFPFEPARRAQPPLNGQSRYVFDIEKPGYYLLYAPNSRTADVTAAQLNELYPQSGAFSSGAQVRGALPTYAAPVAADTTGIHAAVAANAANTFPGPIGTIESWGRNLRVTFAASWDGGDVIVDGTDQFGRAVSETWASAAGSTVAGVKVFRTVTGIRKTAVGATANTASVGIGTAIGVPFSFTAGQEFLNGVAELATINTTYYHFIPGTAANGALNYNFIGW